MADFLLELLCEEIPARMQARAAEDFKRLVTDGLKAAGLAWTRADFPLLQRKIDDRPLTHLDSASTSPKPQCDYRFPCSVFHVGGSSVPPPTTIES